MHSLQMNMSESQDRYTLTYHSCMSMYTLPCVRRVVSGSMYMYDSQLKGRGFESSSASEP